jgi:hypothetical protein
VIHVFYDQGFAALDPAPHTATGRPPAPATSTPTPRCSTPSSPRWTAASPPYRRGDRNPARITGWQDEYRCTEDELDDPRALALKDWATLARLADALVVRSYEQFAGWGHLVRYAACTAAPHRRYPASGSAIST